MKGKVLFVNNNKKWDSIGNLLRNFKQRIPLDTLGVIQ